MYKKLKPILWGILGIWVVAVLLNGFMSDPDITEQAERHSSGVSGQELADASRPEAERNQSQADDLECYPYAPIVPGDQVALNLNGSAYIGYSHAYSLASSQLNPETLSQLKDPETTLFVERLAEFTDLIERKCPRDNLPEELMGYDSGKEIFEVNWALYMNDLLPLETLLARRDQSLDVLTHYSEIFINRLENAR